MNIYLVSQTINNDWDTYDSFVCAAASEADARQMHPCQSVTHVKDGKWMGTRSDGDEYLQYGHGWLEYADIDKVSVQLIGKAAKGTKPGLILASFNAG